jgi:hypothetical protein
MMHQVGEQPLIGSQYDDISYGIPVHLRCCFGQMPFHEYELLKEKVNAHTDEQGNNVRKLWTHVLI